MCSYYIVVIATFFKTTVEDDLINMFQENYKSYTGLQKLCHNSRIISVGLVFVDSATFLSYRAGYRIAVMGQFDSGGRAANIRCLGGPFKLGTFSPAAIL